jgi:exopolysaccharide production protein ExoQ
MPPIVALSLCIGFILLLFRIESQNSKVSWATWIPLIWFMITMSRMVVQWGMDPFGFTNNYSENALLEGSPIDRTIFTVLIVVGIVVLLARRSSWPAIFKNNLMLLILFLYFGLSILWSDFPWVSSKRYIKLIGSFIMVLVVLGAEDPAENIRAMLRRCSYVLIPLSVVFIKYYPQFGRVYHRWSGEASFTGVTTNKNSLGVLCMVCGIFLFSDLMSSIFSQVKKSNKTEFILHLILFAVTFWLLILSLSANSLACFILGILILSGMRLPFIKRNLKSIGFYFLSVAAVILILQLTIDIKQIVITALGRDATLTGRTDIWKEALAMIDNPLIGVGFESFWLGKRIDIFWENYWWHPIQVHNGYAETYLDSGLIGLFLLMSVIAYSYRKIAKVLVQDFEYGILRMVFFIIALMYNVAESSFNTLQPIGFIFLLLIVEYPIPIASPTPSSQH